MRKLVDRLDVFINNGPTVVTLPLLVGLMVSYASVGLVIGVARRALRRITCE